MLLGKIGDVFFFIKVSVLGNVRFAINMEIELCYTCISFIGFLCWMLNVFIQVWNICIV